MASRCFIAGKSYSAIFPVIEAYTNIMKDQCVLSEPFSVSELKHKHGKTQFSIFAINGAISIYQTKSAGKAI